MTDKPTPKEIEDLFVEETGFATDDFPAAIFDFASAVLAKWGAPAPVGAEPYGWHYWNIAGTSVLHLGRSNKLDADIAASEKHPDAHHVVPLYTAPQPVALEQLTYEQIQDLLLCGNPTDEEMRLIRIGWDAAHGIKGGQHG